MKAQGLDGRRMRLIAVCSVLLSIFVTSAAWISPVRAAPPAAPGAAAAIKLGAYAPLTGDYASAGIDIVRAVRLAVANANKAHGVLGRQITLDAQDSPCNPQVAVQAAQKLVTDGVVGVVGPYCSGDAIPASVIYHRANIPMITPASTNPKLTEQGFNDIFRTIGRDDEQGLFAARIIAKSLGAKKIAIIHDNTVYAKGLAEQTRDALSKYSGTNIVLFDAITPGSKDFSAIVTRLRTLNPDVTYFTGYYSDGGLLIKQFFQLGVSGKFMAGDANNDPTFIKLAGSVAQKALITSAPTPELVPTAKSFVRQYRQSYHTGPGPYSAYAYDATNVLLRAIEQTRSTNGAALIRALHQMKGYSGITGKVTFNAKGDRKQIQYIVETVRGGRFVRASVK